MKIKLVAATVMTIAMSASIAATDNASLKTDTDKLSYSIGVDLGKNFKKQNIDMNPQALAAGMKDSMAGGQLQLTEQQMKEVLDNFQKELLARRNAEFNKRSSDNKAKGEAFLSENKQKEGVVELPSGLQYKILKNGSGEKPSKTDTVTVEYTGRLIDGKVFDSSERVGKPATFKVSQVIPGWTEALQLMPAGSEWEIYVPADLAYGPRSVGGPIGPNETLIFKIHLLSVKKDKK
jgi:FKBP-type peptidyl-prolyl cis-trans isomerase FklB